MKENRIVTFIFTECSLIQSLGEVFIHDRVHFSAEKDGRSDRKILDIFLWLFVVIICFVYFTGWLFVNKPHYDSFVISSFHCRSLLSVVPGIVCCVAVTSQAPPPTYSECRPPHSSPGTARSCRPPPPPPHSPPPAGCRAAGTPGCAGLACRRSQRCCRCAP